MKVSVVIPVLNEEEQLAETLASVLTQEGPFEVFVVDGGSEDASREVAASWGVEVLQSSRGRAVQMNAGAAQATGDAVLFLHADTRLPAGGLPALRSVLADQRLVGGCFRLRFDSPGRVLRFYSLPVWMRLPQLVLGDRAIFVRMRAFEALGGFREQPVFEDADLVRRLRRLGRFILLDDAVTTSARRFHSNGVLRQQVRNVVLWLAWRAGVDPRALARWYPVR